MELLIIIIVIIVIVSKRSANGGFYKQLGELMRNPNYTNRKNLFNGAGYIIQRADSHGENYIFTYHTGGNFVTFQEITNMYEVAQKNHIHNRILVAKRGMISTPTLLTKIKEYGIEVWDETTLASFENVASDITNNPTGITSSLKTSDVSDDKCEIDFRTVDPIQEGGSYHRSIIWEIFRRPDKL